MSLIFLRLSFFPEWVKLIRRTFNKTFRKPRRPFRSSSQSNFFFEEEGRDPSKDYTDLKTKPLEHPYRLGSLQFPKSPLAMDLHPPLSSLQSDENTAILENPERPGSSRPGSSRPGTARSNTLTKKDWSKKVSVEDILAMRRMEGDQGSSREYPGIQPTKITRMGSENEMTTFPTYRFGEEREWPKRI